MTRTRPLTRRAVLQSVLAVTGAWTLASCAPGAQPPVPSPTSPRASSAEPRSVPRERTLFIAYGPRRTTPEHQWNPYSAGNGHQNGSGIFYEPLFYYSAFTDTLTPWLAESFAFSSDYRKLTVPLRKGITWSDGQPFTSDDVVFTLDALTGDQRGLPRARSVAEVVDTTRAVDPSTVEITFKVAAPRFVMQLAYWYDMGIAIVPRHVYAGQPDWTRFSHYDPQRGWPLTTGPWRLGMTTAAQTHIERASAWWAVSAGLTSLPAVERIVYMPYEDASMTAIGLRTNQLDCSDAFSPQAMPALLESNPALTTFSGREPPYGYTDWWPISMYVNTEQPVLRDRDVRWALSLFIDRSRLIREALGGAAEAARLPLPSVAAYPGLSPFQDAIQDLLMAHDTLEYNPQKARALLTASGFVQHADDYWRQGSTVLELQVDVLGILNDLGVALVRQLKEAGFAATLRPESADTLDRFNAGEYSLMLFGHPGSVGGDPYDTLALYQSTSHGTPRATASRWKNATYDRVVDEMASTPTLNQSTLREQFRRAMEQWLPELPDIPLVEWYHRIPTNTTYWTGWPSRQDPYINTAFWHLTFPLVLNRLQPAARGP